jgi:RNA 3'-terminal phosphate cyclase (ATP)
VGLIPIDGSLGEGGGQILRTALTLSVATGRGFEATRIRAGRTRPGLRPQHLAAVRASAMLCSAKVAGAVEGSQELRFEPGAIESGRYRFEIGTAGATTLVLQTVLPALALTTSSSRVEVVGGTHVPASPSFHFLATHWRALVSGLGLPVELGLVRAGFHPPGGGEVWSEVRAWKRDLPRLELDRRGSLVAIRGVSGASDKKLGLEVARRQRDAAAQRLWDERRLEAAWDVVEVPAASPGSFLFLEAEHQPGRIALGLLGEKGLRSELLGDRAARRFLRLLELEGAVDPHAADQLVVPMALAGGGRVTTTEVTRHIQTVVAVLAQFGFHASVSGRIGGPGSVEVAG